jgi:asparagine synthase (glutamine-hydrolysing)
VCGIAGVVGKAGDAIDAAEVHRMCQTIVHRGPDDEGIYARGPVGLGMRRLSIIDLAGGKQPIHNEDGSVWVVFNGEIYNFPELRGELQGRGHQFYTHSDTEVIVHLYEEMGADCVKKLRGMFAIALYDEKKKSLLLARDRLGKKPLHYALRQGKLLFGSEIKTILALHPELAEVDHEGLLQYFYFGYIPDPHTAFQRIRKLPAGHVMEFRDGEIKIRQYWDVPEYGTHPPISEEECLVELERRLEEAVRIRLISDVPLGALLSGGVDSSIIVALMARTSAKPVQTFSIGFRAEQFNESEYARMVAERFGTEHHELVLEPDLEETLTYLSGMMEEPFGDSSMLPTYYVCRMARRQVTVALSGDGGDELFAGYDRYLVAMERPKFDPLQRWLGPIYRDRIHGLIPAGMYGKNLAWNASLNDRDRYLDGISFLPALHRERDLFTPEFLQSARRLPDPLLEWQRCTMARRRTTG